MSTPGALPLRTLANAAERTERRDHDGEDPPGLGQPEHQDPREDLERADHQAEDPMPLPTDSRSMFPIDPIRARSAGLRTRNTTPARPWTAPRTMRITPAAVTNCGRGRAGAGSGRRPATTTCRDVAGEAGGAAASLEDSDPQVRLEGNTYP